jgi:hypothetical protein
VATPTGRNTWTKDQLLDDLTELTLYGIQNGPSGADSQ